MFILGKLRRYIVARAQSENRSSDSSLRLLNCTRIVSRYNKLVYLNLLHDFCLFNERV